MVDRESLTREWAAFGRMGRLLALVAAVLSVVGLGLVTTSGVHAECDGPCPAPPVGVTGSVVSDRFWFAHRDLGPQGSITARLTDMTGTITYPPPDHDAIVPGLVPWAKTGLLVKDGLDQGSTYAAVMMTGEHGVRMQYDYEHDIAGTAGQVSAESPRWLRLTRDGDTITGYESSDGEQWQRIGTATLDGLPDTVQVGLFAASPGDLSLDEVGLGGSVETVRFTQATGVFDEIALTGAVDGDWRSDPVGRLNQTDWEKDHHASGAVVDGDTVTVSGTGDIGPMAEDDVDALPFVLPGLPIGLVVVLVVAAGWGARRSRTMPGGSRAAAMTVVAGSGLLVGLVAIGVSLWAGLAILRSNAVPVVPLSFLEGVQVTVGLAVVLAIAAVLACGLGALLRRRWAAITAALSLVAVPYLVTTLPLLPDPVAQWLLRLTPAAGFALGQTRAEYAQVVAHYAPSSGYFPLPGWAGLAVLCAWSAAVWWLAFRRPERPA